MTVRNSIISPAGRNRRKLIAKGLCPHCRDGTPVATGRSACDKHLFALRTYKGSTHYKHYRDAWLEKGLCARCGKLPHEPGKTQCVKCAHRKRMREATAAGPWEDLTGCIAGSWLVHGLIGKPASGDYLWDVRCNNCGTKRELLTSNIRATPCLYCRGEKRARQGCAVSCISTAQRLASSGASLICRWNNFAP